MENFKEWAAKTFSDAGHQCSDRDLELVELIYVSSFGQFEALDHLDLTHFPLEPVDPRVAPEPR